MSSESIFARQLPQWRIDQKLNEPSLEGPFWSDSTGLTIQRGSRETYFLRFHEGAAFLVDYQAKSVTIFGGSESKSLAVEHLLLDQIVPRILSHGGRLVIHGAGIVVGGRLIVIIGKSGRGKSTLTSWFVSEGYEIIGDDAVVITQEDGVVGSGLGPKLRLRRDTAQMMAARIEAPLGDAGYAEKVAFDLPFRDDVRASIAAIFKLVEPEDEMRLSQSSASSACMALVEESFALDPLDFELAGARLRQAAFVAGKVPCYDLAYPRRYEALGDVCGMMVGAI